mmetsp:Transcript_22409/g.56859  ORF Transcript_22409/g.56859 Transcript_22409/m.56859 type:complete len:156 (-) Transcript_22409:77-544(-)
MLLGVRLPPARLAHGSTGSDDFSKLPPELSDPLHLRSSAANASSVRTSSHASRGFSASMWTQFLVALASKGLIFCFAALGLLAALLAATLARTAQSWQGGHALIDSGAEDKAHGDSAWPPASESDDLGCDVAGLGRSVADRGVPWLSDARAPLLV